MDLFKANINVHNKHAQHDNMQDVVYIVHTYLKCAHIHLRFADRNFGYFYERDDDRLFKNKHDDFKQFVTLLWH